MNENRGGFPSPWEKTVKEQVEREFMAFVFPFLLALILGFRLSFVNAEIERVRDENKRLSEALSAVETVGEQSPVKSVMKGGNR